MNTVLSFFLLIFRYTFFIGFLFDSTFNSNNNFKNKFIEATSKDTYEIVESNFDKILFAEEDLIKLNNKLALEEHNDAPIQAKITKQKHILKNDSIRSVRIQQFRLHLPMQIRNSSRSFLIAPLLCNPHNPHNIRVYS